MLSAFEVNTKSDNGYGALNSNSLTSFNADLKTLPITDDVMTRAFIDDVAGTSVDALVSTFGLAGGQSAVGSDGGATTMAGDRALSNSGNGGPTARGLTGGGTRVNGFPVKGGAGQLFDVERAEIIQGPQGLLYGAVGVGGVINTVLNRAQFDRTFGAVRYQLDQFGTKFGTIDSNWGNDKIAVRVDLQGADQAYSRYNLGGPITGTYVQLAFNLLPNTILRVSAENVTNKQVRNASLTLNMPAGNGHVADPRNTLPLRVLVASGQASDLDNGHVSFGTMDSFVGNMATERIITSNYQAVAETKVNRWLSTQVGAMWDEFWQENATAGTVGLTPAGYSTNPFNTWAIGLSPSNGTQLWRRKAVRGSGVIDFPFMNGKARNRTLFGADYWSATNTNVGYAYYQADANGNVLTNPALVTANNPYGRTTLPTAMWVAVPDGPKRLPLTLMPFGDRYTNPQTGVNYVRLPMNYINSVTPTATNPDGYNGASGPWHQESHSGGVYLADFADWFDERLTTLGGVRIEDEHLSRRGAQLNPPEFKISAKPVSANFGVNYQLLSWLRPYASYSNAEGVPNVLNADPVGALPKNPKGHATEVGLKFNTHDGKFSGVLSAFRGTNQNDQYQISSTAAINPNGGNGTVQPSSVWAAVERRAQGLSLELTADPTPNWRSRLVTSIIDSTTNTTKTYAQYYNDQFFTDKSGGVTWSDGTPYLVPVTPGNAAGPTQQLTIAMLNGTDPTNKSYIATLDPDSGVITNRSTVFPTTTSAVHGTVFTGVNGLPISAIQLNWGDPNGHHGVIPVVAQGERSPNFAKYQFTWTNNYRFSQGPLKGLSVGGTLLGRFHAVGFYYNQTVLNSAGKATGTVRRPFNLPDYMTVSPMISYQFRINRFTVISQLNVANVLNDYHWQLEPNPASGTYNYSAIYSQTPRTYTWSNSIRF